MKKNLLLFTALFISKFLFAQDSLRSQDFAAANDTFIISVGTAFAGMDPAATGTNYSWDFSTLGRSSQYVDSIFDPSNTNALLAFVFINSPFNTNRANLATHGQNFNLGTVGLSDVFNYYYNSSTDYSQPGFGAVVNGIPIPVTFSPHDVIYRFPLAYNSEDSVTYHYELDLTSTVGFFYYVVRSRHNLVDGWGSLKTPYGTFDVLRMKSTVVERDSFYIDTLHAGINLPPVTTFEYKWLGAGAGDPLLQINTSSTNVVSNILYQDSIHTTGINEPDLFNGSATVFPNPSSDIIIVSYDLLKNTDVSFTFISADGREIFRDRKRSGQVGKNFEKISLANYQLADGNYFLIMNAGKSRTVVPVIIKNN
jgi:hypothetical protein